MAGDPTGHLSRAEAEVEAMATSNDNIFYVPADILSGLGIRYHARSDSITMPKTMAQCVKRKLQSEEEFNPFELDTSRVANPRFGNDDYSFEFAPEGDRVTIVVLGDIEVPSLFAELRECISGADNPSMPGGRKPRRKKTRKARRKSKKTRGRR